MLSFLEHIIILIKEKNGPKYKEKNKPLAEATKEQSYISSPLNIDR